MKNLTVGHHKEIIDRMERDNEFSKKQIAKIIDRLHERERRRQKQQSCWSSTETYQPQLIPWFAKQLGMYLSESKSAWHFAANCNQLLFVCNNRRYF